MDIWSVLILFLVAQGVFVLSIFMFSRRRRRKKENLFLFVMALVFIWLLAEFFAVRNVIKVNFDLFYGTRYGSWFILGPLTYFFYKSVTQKAWSFSFKSSLQLLPFFVFAILIPLLSAQSLSSRQIHYGMLAVFDHRPKTVSPFEYLYSTVFYLQFVHLGAYLVLNQFKLISYRKKLKSEYSQSNETIWLYVFNLLMLLSLVLATVFLYLLFASDSYRRAMDYIYVLPMGLFIYAVGYKLSGIDWIRPPETKKRYSSSNLKAEEKIEYGDRLKVFMDEKKPFLKNDLRLTEMAEMLQIPQHHLSQVINEKFGSTFFDFINEFRVQEAKRIITKQPELTMLQVAFDAGFNNKTSFVNAFKKFEGSTPSVFRKTYLQSLA